MSSSSEESEESESEEKPAPKVNGKVSMAPSGIVSVFHIKIGEGSHYPSQVHPRKGQRQSEGSLVI